VPKATRVLRIRHCTIELEKIDSNRFALANRMGSFRFGAIRFHNTHYHVWQLAANLITYLTAHLYQYPGF